MTTLSVANLWKTLIPETLLNFVWYCDYFSRYGYITSRTVLIFSKINYWRRIDFNINFFLTWRVKHNIHTRAIQHKSKRELSRNQLTRLGNGWKNLHNVTWGERSLKKFEKSLRGFWTTPKLILDCDFCNSGNDIASLLCSLAEQADRWWW